MDQKNGTYFFMSQVLGRSLQYPLFNAYTMNVINKSLLRVTHKKNNFKVAFFEGILRKNFQSTGEGVRITNSALSLRKLRYRKIILLKVTL